MSMIDNRKEQERAELHRTILMRFRINCQLSCQVRNDEGNTSFSSKGVNNNFDLPSYCEAIE